MTQLLSILSFLAHDMEEDNEDLKIVIFEWALGIDWRDIVHHLIQPRDALFKRMEHRAAVSRATCEEVYVCPFCAVYSTVDAR